MTCLQGKYAGFCRRLSRVHEHFLAERSSKYVQIYFIYPETNAVCMGDVVTPYVFHELTAHRLQETKETVIHLQPVFRI